MANVRFLNVKLRQTFDALETKDDLALYWISETSELFKGNQLYGTGALASEQAAGLLSAEDYVALKSLIANSDSNNELFTLSAIDGTINVTDTNNGKAIGVALAPIDGNTLVAVDGGLFVPTVVVPAYSIERQEVAEEGFAASYKLKKVVNGEISYVGDAINIAKDLVLQSASLEVVTEDGVPYDGAIVGDPYICMIFNDTDTSNLYIPVKGLVDKFEAGVGIEIIDNKISVKLADVTHGLVAIDGALTLNLATKDNDGAMSKEDKRIIDAIPYVYQARKFEIDDAPVGTLVNYREDEIRIMCPKDTMYTKQTVGAGGDSNTYYVTFKTYAPSKAAVGYIEKLGDYTDPEILTDIKVDQYGRRYQPTWLGIAKFDETTGTWAYYGDKSSSDKMIGWDYRIDWYNSDDIKIHSDSIRINLSNEDCHTGVASASVQAVVTEVESVKETVEEIKQAYSWGEL